MIKKSAMRKVWLIHLTVLKFLLLALPVSGATSNGPIFSATLGNGGAYNGPDLGGEAVPVGADGGYTWSDVRVATGACLTRFLADLWQQAYRIPLSEAEPNRTSSVIYHPRGCEVTAILEPVPGKLIEFSGHSCHVADSVLSLKADQGPSQRYVLKGGLPLLVLGSINEVAPRDINGAPARIVRPDSRVSTLRSLESETPADFRIQLPMYESCLRGELLKKRY